MRARNALRSAVLLLLAPCVMAVPLAAAGAAPETAEMAHDPALVALGKRIYLEGLDSHGQPIQAELSQGQPLEGAGAACVSCHRRSGQGSQEGRVLIPPITAPTLLRDGVFLTTAPGVGAERAALMPHYQTRHAYRPDTLVRALTQGIDAEGRPLADPMPRFHLGEPEQAALLQYLEQLGRDGSLAADHDGLHFWVVLGAQADVRRRTTVRAVVDAFASDLPAGSAPWHVHVVDYGRDADALWKAQVEGGTRPLALLSGAGAADWLAFEQYCERERVPCVFPSLAALQRTPGRTASGFYSLYWSEGLVLEARALGELVRSDPDAACREPVILMSSAPPGVLGLPPPAADGIPDPQRVAPLVEPLALQAGLAALRSALPEARIVDLAVHPLEQLPRCAVAWLAPVELGQIFAAWPAPVGRWRIPYSLQPLRGQRPPGAWVSHVEYVSALDPETPLRFRGGLEPWLQRHRLRGLDERAAADALGACTLTLAALSAMDAERIRGMRNGPITREEFVEALEQVTNRLRLPGVEHYSPVNLGGVSRVVAHTASVLAYPGPEAPEPRLVRRLTPP